MNCKNMVWEGWTNRRCSRKAVTDGYCKQHHPDTVNARRLKQEARWAADRERSKNLRRLSAIQLLSPELCESCAAKLKGKDA